MLLKRFGPAALACILLLGACGQQADGPVQEAGEDEKKDEAPPIPVETGVPERGDIYAVYTGTAPIEAFAEADIIAKVGGEVRELLVEEGDVVARDQVLARLDGEKLRLELRESEANLHKLQRDYERKTELMDMGLISSGDFEKIKYEMEALEAAYNLARLELDYTKIRAPFAGVISQRFIKIGNTIAMGEPTFTVTSYEPLVTYLHIPEREYRRIRAGQPVGIDIDAVDGPPITTSVARVSPVVDPVTGTFKITIEIQDDQRRIKPGMFARIGIVYDKHENALKVPRTAVLEDGDESSIFVVENDKAIRKSVVTGYSDKGMVEILDGISDGDQVIIAGQAGIKDEAGVTVINAADSGEIRVSENAQTD